MRKTLSFSKKLENRVGAIWYFIERFGRVATNGLKVLESLYSRPIINVKSIAGLTDTSFTAANQLLQKFLRHGLLSEITGQARNRRFRYNAYIDLFAEET